MATTVYVVMNPNIVLVFLYPMFLFLYFVLHFFAFPYTVALTVFTNTTG